MITVKEVCYEINDASSFYQFIKIKLSTGTTYLIFNENNKYEEVFYNLYFDFNGKPKPFALEDFQSDEAIDKKIIYTYTDFNHDCFRVQVTAALGKCYDLLRLPKDKQSEGKETVRELAVNDLLAEAEAKAAAYSFCQCTIS
jgi:hypothetical protein